MSDVTPPKPQAGDPLKPGDPGYVAPTVPAAAATPGDPNSVSTYQTDAAGSNSGDALGAYDVFGNQAFGGPTDAENNTYYGTQAIANGQSMEGQQAAGLMAQAGQNAAGQGQQAYSKSQLDNAMQSAANQYAGQDRSGVPLNQQLGAYQTMVGPNGGYSADTQAAIANQGSNALNSQQASMSDQLQNAAARTGSPVGAYGAMVDVNQNIGDQRASQARQNQILFANEKQRQLEAGASGLGANAAGTLAGENAASQNFLNANQAEFGQGQTTANQAEQFLNDSTSRRMAGLNSMSAQNAQQRGYQQAGGAGLANLEQQQNVLQGQGYNQLMSILGLSPTDQSQANSASVGTQLSSGLF